MIIPPVAHSLRTSLLCSSWVFGVGLWSLRRFAFESADVSSVVVLLLVHVDFKWCFFIPHVVLKWCFLYFICCKDPNRNYYVRVFLNCPVCSIVAKVPIEITSCRVS